VWAQWNPPTPTNFGLSKTFVQVKFRAGGSAVGQAREFGWLTDGGAADIVAFRNYDNPGDTSHLDTLTDPSPLNHSSIHL